MLREEEQFRVGFISQVFNVCRHTRDPTSTCGVARKLKLHTFVQLKCKRKGRKTKSFGSVFPANKSRRAAMSPGEPSIHRSVKRCRRVQGPQREINGPMQTQRGMGLITLTSIMNLMHFNAQTFLFRGYERENCISLLGHFTRQQGGKQNY